MNIYFDYTTYYIIMNAITYPCWDKSQSMSVKGPQGGKNADIVLSHSSKALLIYKDEFSLDMKGWVIIVMV